VDPGTDSLLVSVLGEPSGIDETEQITARILEGARDLFCRVGIQRATMEEIARSSGYSRITVYRRFATKEELVEQVVRWEFRQYFAQFRDDIRSADSAAERVVSGFVSSLRTMRGNSFIGGLLAAEPGHVVASMVGEQGRTLALVREFLSGQLRAEQAAGNVRADLDVALVAELMVRVTTSFLVTPSEIVDLDDDQQLADLARQFLVPMLDPPRPAG